MPRQYLTTENYERIYEASDVYRMKINQRKFLRFGLFSLTSGASLIISTRAELGKDLIQIILQINDGNFILMVLYVSGLILAIFGVLLLLKAIEIRTRRDLNEKLLNLPQRLARLVGTYVTRSASEPRVVTDKKPAERKSEPKKRWDTLTTPELLRDGLRYRPQYVTCPLSGTTVSADRLNAYAAVDQSLQNELKAGRDLEGKEDVYKAGKGKSQNFLSTLSPSLKGLDGFSAWSGHQSLPSPSYSYKVYYPRAMRSGDLELKETVSPETFTIQADALQHVLTRQGIERSFSNLTDATRRYLAAILKEKYAAPLKWATDELIRCGIEPNVAKQVQMRQAVYKFPGTLDQLYNMTLKDIIYKGLERFKSMFDSTNPNTGTVVNILDFYQDLERILLVSANPGYVYERLQQLAGDTQLGGMRWDGGGVHLNMPWNPTLPNDAELVMHMFCCRCDELLARNAQERLDGRPFVARYYDEIPAAALDPARYRSRVVIVRTDVLGELHGNGMGGGPHYQIVATGEVWTIPRGRLNVFQAITLFLWAVKRYKSGYLGDSNLRHEILDEIFVGPMSSG